MGLCFLVFVPRTSEAQRRSVPAPAPSTADRLTYTAIGTVERSPTAAAPNRMAVKIRVRDDLTRAEARALLARAAEHLMSTHHADAIMVFAYRARDATEAGYTVGRAIRAPDGRWERAGKTGELRTTVDLEERYWTEPRAAATGAIRTIALRPNRSSVVVSRRFESWGDADLVGRLPAGTKVTVLETRSYGSAITRYQVRATVRGKVITGWVHDSDVER